LDLLAEYLVAMCGGDVEAGVSLRSGSNQHIRNMQIQVPHFCHMTTYCCCHHLRTAYYTNKQEYVNSF